MLLFERVLVSYQAIHDLLVVTMSLWRRSWSFCIRMCTSVQYVRTLSLTAAYRAVVLELQRIQIGTRGKLSRIFGQSLLLPNWSRMDLVGLDPGLPINSNKAMERLTTACCMPSGEGTKSDRPTGTSDNRSWVCVVYDAQSASNVGSVPREQKSSGRDGAQTD